jgi:hypothetical protein
MQHSPLAISEQTMWGCLSRRYPWTQQAPSSRATKGTDVSWSPWTASLSERWATPFSSKVYCLCLFKHFCFIYLNVMLDLSLVNDKWRVLRLRMKETAPKYGRQLQMYWIRSREQRRIFQDWHVLKNTAVKPISSLLTSSTSFTSHFP